MRKNLNHLFVSLFLIVTGQLVQAQEVSLEPGKPLDREIVGGQSHTYQINLAAGQFVSVVAEQKAIDVALTLAAPDGKKVVEANFSGAGGLESLSAEAAASGDYRLTVRAAGVATLAGSYQARLEVKAAATAQDRQRIAAEALMLETNELRKQGGKTAEQTVDKLQKALSVWRELGDQYWVAWSLYNIGFSYASLSSLTSYEKAIEYYAQALTIYREVNNRAGEGTTLGSMGNSYLNLSRYEKAIEYLEQAITIHREVKNRAGEGIALGQIGFAYVGSSRYEKAIEHLEQALAIAREVKNRVSEGNALNSLGYAYRNLSRYDKSIEYYEQALAIYREGKNRVNEGITLNSLGGAYRSLSRYEKAIEYYEQALAIAREVKNRTGEGGTLNSLGIAYGSMGRHEKAIEYVEQALAISREVKNRVGEGAALNNLGLEYGYLGRHEKAIEYYEQALIIAREIKNRAGEGDTVSAVGAAYRNLDRHEKAIEYYEQALAIAREVKNRAGEGTALNGLGNTYYSLSRNEKAIEYYEQALAIRREVKDRAYEAYTLYSLARAESTQGNFVSALTYIEESLKIAESIRSDILSPESSASFLANVQSSYQLYTDLLMRQHKAEPTKGLDALAVDVSERQRARSLLDLLTEARTDVRQGVDAALIERELMLAKQLNDKAQQLARATKPEQSVTLKQEVSQLENDLERAQAAIRKANPRYAALVQPQPLKLKEIQLLLDEGTLLLEYALGQDRSYLWAITKDSLTSYELPKGEQIKQSALQVYELLRARNIKKSGETASQRTARITDAEAKLPAAAQALSQMLLAPAAAQLGSKRLVIVADGALQYVPFAMLPEPVGIGEWAVGSEKKNSNRPLATDHRPLIVGHEVISLPSASALAIQRTELAGRQSAPKVLAVIADPVFDRTDVRFKTALPYAVDQAQTAPLADTRGLEHITDPFDGKTGRLVIRRLRFTRQEADALLALTPKTSSFRAVDFQANRANILNGDLAQYRYVHFATHGLLDTERPGLSSLVLSTVDADGKPQDGFLRANDIYNMKLPAELVVLSACQTGLGKEIKGEGLISLTRGFMYAGAKRVVVSLWSVNDKATSDLMTKFYRGMLKNNERPAAALRAAQIEMWKQKQWQSPYYWAAFTMQGEWR